MRQLPNGNYEIENSQTGEKREVSAMDLPKYGINLPAPTPQTSPIEQQVRQSPGLIESAGNAIIGMGKAMAQPFIGTAEKAGAALETAKLLATSPAFRKQVQGKKLTDAETRELATYKPLFESTGKSQEKNIKETAGNLMQVASYAVPFGKGASVVQKALIPGAVVGGTSEAGRELAAGEDLSAGKIVGSTALGAALPVAGYGIGKLKGVLTKGGGKVTEAGKELERSIRQIKLPAEVGGAQKEDLINQALDELGVFKGSPQNQYKQLQPAMTKLETNLRQSLTDNSQVFKPKDIKNEIINVLDDQGFLIGEAKRAKADTALNDVMTDVITKNKSKELTSIDLFNVKQKLNSISNRISNKIDRGIPATPEEEILMATRDALDDVIATHHPDVKAMTLAQSRLFDSARSLSAARGNVPTLRMGGTSLPGVATITAKRAGAAALKGTGALVEGAGKITPQLTGNIAGQVESRLPLATEALNQGANKPQGGIEQQPGNEQPQGNLNYQDHTSQYITKHSPEEHYAAYMKAREAGDKGAMKQIMEDYNAELAHQKTSGTGVKKKTETQQKFVNSASAAQQALDLLKSGGVSSGIGQGILGGIGEKTGLNTQAQQQYRSTLAVARTAVRNAMLGANMTPKELESIQAFIPEFDDAPNIAQVKLETFIKLMNEFGQNLEGTQSLPTTQNLFPEQ